MFNFFRKKKAKDSVKRNVVSRAKVSVAKVERVEPYRLDVKKVEPVKPWYEMRYRDNSTGEVHTFDTRDSKAFDEVMSRKDVTLVFV